MFPFRTGIGAGGGSAKPVLIGVTASTSSTILVHADAQDGDMMILIAVARNSAAGTPSNAAPSGFSFIGSDKTGTVDSGGVRYSASHKIRAGETSLTGSLTGTAVVATMLRVYRSTEVWGSPINAFIGSVSSTSPSGGSVNPSDAFPASPAGVMLGLTWVNGSGAGHLTMNPAAEDVDVTGGLEVGEIIYGSGAVTNAISSNISSGGVVGGFYVPVGS